MATTKRTRTSQQSKKIDPSVPSLASQRQAPAVDLCRDVYGGTPVLRAKHDIYLEQFPRETDKAYRLRWSQAVLYNAFRRTVRGLTGMVFQKPIVLGEDVPVEIRGQEAAPATETEGAKVRVEGHWENIDGAGRRGDVFCRDSFVDGAIDGHSCILVEFPRVETDGLSWTDVQKKSPRPYWIDIKKSDVLRARPVVIDGRMVLGRFAYVQRTIESADGFEEAEVVRVREYRRAMVKVEGKSAAQPGVTVDVWMFNQTKQEWIHEVQSFPLMKSRTAPYSRIPITAGYTNRTGFFESEPPLLDLAYENILHFQVRADRGRALHVAGIPVPVFIGLDDTEGDGTVEVGVSTGIKCQIGGDAKYLEPAGASLGHSRTELQDIEQRMAALGLSMLVRETRAAETAEAKRIDKSADDSQLATWGQGHEDAVEEALSFHAEWIGKEDGGSAEVNRDFGTEMLDPQMVLAISQLVGDRRITLDTMWDILLAGRVLPSTFKPEREKQLLEDDAEQAQELAKLAARLRQKQPPAEDDEDADGERRVA
jgi:hypothetical protein